MLLLTLQLMNRGRNKLIAVMLRRPEVARPRPEIARSRPRPEIARSRPRLDVARPMPRIQVG
jgi:hypothetical protein